MNDQADFIRMICQHPDDDAPRLVFADWLDEQGDAERAEFIRLGVRVGSASLDPDEQWDAGVRYRKLEVTVVPRLLEQLPSVNGVAWHAIVDRGFIARIDVYRPDVLLIEWPTLFNASPIRYLRLTDLSASTVSGLYDVPSLRQLKAIELRGASLTTRGLRQLFHLPQLVGLLHFDVSHQGIGDQGVAELSQTRCLLNLRSLNLNDNMLTDVSAQMLLDAPYLRRLELLYLSRNRISSTLLNRLRKRYRNVLVGV
jgi:uncharacterized protein (TIGR02996 family)